MTRMRHKTKSHRNKSHGDRSPAGNWGVDNAILVQAMGVAAGQHKNGDLDAAEQSCNDILARNGKHPDALTLLAMICHQSGRNDRAVTLCTEVLRRNKKLPAAWFVLANAEMVLGHPKQAQRAVKSLLKLQPDHPAADALNGWLAGQPGV